MDTAYAPSDRDVESGFPSSSEDEAFVDAEPSSLSNPAGSDNSFDTLLDSDALPRSCGKDKGLGQQRFRQVEVWGDHARYEGSALYAQSGAVRGLWRSERGD